MSRVLFCRLLSMLGRHQVALLLQAFMCIEHSIDEGPHFGNMLDESIPPSCKASVRHSVGTSQASCLSRPVCAA